MKRIVICADGTWASADLGSNPSNVVKIARAILPRDNKGIPQMVFYDKGIGSNKGASPLSRMLAGMIGLGLEQNVWDGYRQLAQNYEPEDEIYFFGFSRGAYTVRSLAGFIGSQGLLAKVDMDQFRQAWRGYRKRRSYSGKERARPNIACIGVWDTVGALGIPTNTVLSKLNKGANKKHAFHDVTMGKTTRCALHALSIDELRKPFLPTLWREVARDNGGAPKHGELKAIEQVWFRGVHTDIGGGYPSAGLSDIALDWMIKRVQANTGLQFDSQYIKDKIHPDIHAKMHDSHKFYYSKAARAINAKNADNSPKFAGEMLHPSVLKSASHPKNLAKVIDATPIAP